MNLLLFLLYMIPGSFFHGAYDLSVKRVLKRGVSEEVLLAVGFLSAAIVLMPFLFVFGVPVLGDGFWFAFMVTVALNLVSQRVWYKAYKLEDASLIAPLKLLIPPLVAVTGFFILGEKLSLISVLGIFITIGGLWYFLSQEAFFKKLILFEFIKRPGILLGFLGAFLWALSFPLDKKAITLSSALFFGVLFFLFVGGVTLLFWIAKSLIRYKSHSNEVISSFHDLSLLFQARKEFVVLVGVHALGSILAYQALNYAPAVYASTVKRFSSVWTVFLSGRFLREKNIGRKLFATFIMIVGVAVMFLYG